MRTKVGSSKRLAGLLALALVTGLVPGFFSAAYAAPTLVVDDNVIGQPSDCAGTPNSTHNSVPLAVAAAGVGDTILVCEGTFPLGATTLYFNFDDMTLQGSGAGVTALTSSVGGDTWGIANNTSGTPDGLSFLDFSLTHLPDNSVGGFGMHFHASDGGVIEGVNVSNFKKTQIDINSSTDWGIDNVTATGAGGGNGFQSTDAHDITYNDITATGNAWGGVGVLTRGFDGPHGTDGIVFTGNNTLDAPGKNAPIYLEGFNEFDQTNPVPITYSNDPLDGAEVTVQSSDVNFAYEGVYYDNPGVVHHYYSALFATLAEARDAATAPEWKPLDPGTVRNISTGEYYPVAPGDPVETEPGDTVTTDEGDGEPTPSNPQTTSVTTPVGGPVTIEETPTHTESLPNDYSFFGDQVNITADPSANPNPLVITFKFDASTLNPPDPNNVIVRRGGVEVPACDAGNGTSAIPDPCVESQGVDGNGDLVIVVYTTAASPWDFITPTAACTITGTPGDDTLFGTPGDDVICGLGGNDTIYGRGGNDELHGQDGNDTLYGNGGNDLFFGGDGDDDFFGGGGSDEMYGGLGNDRMWGNQGGDQMYGGDGDDKIVGHGGPDIIEGGNGDDDLLAGDGNNTIDGGAGDDYVRSGSGADNITTEGGADEIYAGRGNNNIDSGGGNDTVFTGDDADIIVTGTGDDYVDSGWGDDDIDTDGGNDAVFSGGGTNTIDVGGGDDYVLTGNGPDTVTGGDGNDKIETGLGDDVVYGNDGNDALYLGHGNNFADAGEGDNYVLGGPGADLILAGSGFDVIDGLGGDNVINAGDGPNAVFAGAGNNSVVTGSGADYISLGAGADTIFAGDGSDSVYAGRGTNTINGEGGDDYLRGGEDNDAFDGGPGTDTCNGGGLGADTFANCENVEP
ncbi:MAG: hypothetical protein JJE05_01830 [Actinobacteria bacterium]|nr:hypothetical protein [Actinomycetota bacterium]